MYSQPIGSADSNFHTRVRQHGVIALVLALLLTTGCSSGGDSGSTPPPPPPPPVGIGPAGGTVTGSNGATIVVPAGALAQTIDLKVTEIAPGSANLPLSTERVGAVYALTPHGTAFSTAVTVTLPFDATLVPAGRDVQFIKTTDAVRTVWETVAGATISGTNISGQLTSFSDVNPSLVPIAPEITDEPDDVTVDLGQTATFEVAAEENGASLSYQWYENSVVIPGATSASYTTPPTVAGDNGDSFYVEISNTAGSVVSRTVLLTVNTAFWTTVGIPLVPLDTLGNPTVIRYPSVAVADDGTVYVSYVIGSSGDYGLDGTLRVSKWDGTNWSPVGGDLNDVVNPTPPHTTPERPYLQIGSDDNPVVAWLNRFPDASQLREIVVQQFDNAEWQRIGLGEPNVASPGVQVGAPILQLRPLGDGTDQFYLNWSEGTCNAFRTWIDPAWEPDNQRACHVSNQSGIGMAVTSGGTVYLAGSPVPPPPSGALANWISVRYRGAGDDGFFNSSLGGSSVNDTSVEEIMAADLTLNSSEWPVLAYAFSNRVDGKRVTELVVAEWSGAAWTHLGGGLLGNDPQGINAPLDPLVTTSPMRVASKLGVTGVAWTSGTAASSRIAVRFWDGAAWADVPAPHPAGTNVGHFSIAIGPGNKPYVAYTERPTTEANHQLGESLIVRTCDNWCIN